MLRILSHRSDSGPVNMAIDEALLECASGPVFRTYEWQPVTLSLGYFQDFETVVASLPEPMPVVRRITGGGAIWHGGEITYALAGTLGENGVPSRTRDLYPWLHGKVLEGLNGGEAPITSQSASVGDRRYRDEPRCFASPAADDLVRITGGKVLGSAARARGTRFLMHGSLKFASNPWDGEVTGSCGLPPGETQKVLIQSIESLLGPGEPSQLSKPEVQACQRIERMRYDTDAWVRQRQGPKG